MHFQIDRKLFQLAIQRCLNIVEKSNTKPCLANVLLRTEENRLLLTATDMELSIHTKIDAEVIEQGSITVAAKTLYDLLREWINVDTIQVILENQKLNMRSGRSMVGLKTIPADEYPVIHQEISGTEITIPSGVLAEMIAATKFSISDDTTRLHLTGLLIEGSAEHGLRLVSTDAHRLSFCQYELEPPLDIEEPVQIIVPKKAVQEFQRLSEDFEEQDATLTLGTRHIQLRIGAHSVSSKIIDARYPLYEEVLPSNNSLKITLPKKEFDQILRRFIVLANEFTHDVRATFSDNALHLVTVNKDQEIAEDFLALQYQGEEINIGMNARYIRDVLAVLQTDMVEMELEMVKAPILISEVALGIEKKFIVMPLAIQ
ncbi:MAG: DNA polymerase III subunit beta [Mariprofundales bacterium]|nr:DNA polymerase III subunit beta [Mariprofundales bacterium]